MVQAGIALFYLVNLTAGNSGILLNDVMLPSTQHSASTVEVGHEICWRAMEPIISGHHYVGPKNLEMSAILRSLMSNDHGLTVGSKIMRSSARKTWSVTIIIYSDIETQGMVSPARKQEKPV